MPLSTAMCAWLQETGGQEKLLFPEERSILILKARVQGTT